MPLTKKSPTIGPFKLGMNNRLADTALNTKDGDFLRSAVNVDIDAGGLVQRRPGTTRTIAGTDCHSIWSDPSNTLVYYVDGTTLFRIVNGAAITVRTGLTPSRHMSFDSVNGIVYYSNGIETGKIIGSTNSSWGLALPPRQFGLSVVPGAGTMAAGTYRIYSVFVTADGQESGSSDVQSITLVSAVGTLGTGGTRNDETGENAISVTGLPTVLPADVVGVTLYMTTPGSEIFMRATGVLTTGSYLIATQPDPDLTGKTQGFSPMPAGNIVRYYNSRMITALDNILFYSEAYSLSLHNPADDFIEFQAPISLVMPVQNGVYVCADQTYWLKGELADTELVPSLPYGGVPGTDVLSINKNAVYWMSVRGLCTGDDNGSIKALSEDNVAMDQPLVGASLMRELNGVRQVISSNFGIETSNVAAKTYLTAEVIRKGTSL